VSSGAARGWLSRSCRVSCAILVAPGRREVDAERLEGERGIEILDLGLDLAVAPATVGVSSDLSDDEVRPERGHVALEAGEPRAHGLAADALVRGLDRPDQDYIRQSGI
jgi:hypothetical protein